MLTLSREQVTLHACACALMVLTLYLAVLRCNWVLQEREQVTLHTRACALLVLTCVLKKSTGDFSCKKMMCWEYTIYVSFSDVIFDFRSDDLFVLHLMLHCTLYKWYSE